MKILSAGFLFLVASCAASSAESDKRPDGGTGPISGGGAAYESLLRADTVFAAAGLPIINDPIAGRSKGAPPIQAEAAPKVVSPGAPPIQAEPAPKIERKIIFNGSLLVQVADPEEAERELRKITEQAQGWLHKIEGTVFTVRVPAAQFHATVGKFSELGKVLDRKIAGTEVTEEFVDLQVRIDNAEKARQKLQELYDKAKDAKEALEVYRELAKMSEEIDRMKGRLKYLADHVTFSTIAVDLRRAVPAGYAQHGPRYPFPWVRELGLPKLMSFWQ